MTLLSLAAFLFFAGSACLSMGAFFEPDWDKKHRLAHEAALLAIVGAILVK